MAWRMMTPYAHRLATLLIGVPIVVLILWFGGLSSTASQDATSVSITSVQHEPGEGLTVSVSTDDPAAQLRVLVDGKPQQVLVSSVDNVQPAHAVVVVIEASESMRLGAAPALAAARSIVDALGPGDQVAVVSFSAAPAVLYGPGSDLERAREAIDALPIGGGSDLYGGIVSAASQLDELTADSKSIAVITYGWDWAGTSAVGRTGSLDAVMSSGARVYPLLLGTDFDYGYLVALAGTSDGVIRGLDRASELPGLIARQDPMSSMVKLEVDSPLLALGPHRVEVLSAGSAASAEFEVTNEGLIPVEVVSPPDQGDPIRIRIAVPLSHESLSLNARLEGQDLPIDDGTISVDPWLFGAGARSVELIAQLDGAQIYSAEVGVTIPSLEPEIHHMLEDVDSGQVLHGVWRVQGAHGALARVLVDGEAVLSTADREFQLDVRAGTQIEVRIEATGGVILASEALEVSAGGLVAAPAESDRDLELDTIMPYAAIGLLVVSLLAISLFAARIIRRRLIRLTARIGPHRLRASDMQAPTVPTGRLDRDLALVATRLDGRALTTVNVPFPADADSLTIGASPQCDVPLRGPDITFLHAILDRTSDGRLRIQFLGDVASTPETKATAAERLSKEMVRRVNEPFAIGGYTLRVADGETSTLAEEDWGHLQTDDPTAGRTLHDAA